MSKSKKILLGTGVVLTLAIVVGGVWYWGAPKELLPIDGEEFLKANPNPSQRQLEQFLKNQEEVYRKDTYGGATPEETLNLFIAALKAGDTDLAARYFLPEKQEEIKRQLKQGLQSGGVEALLESFAAEQRGIQLDDTSYRFRSFSKKLEADFIVDLILNPLNREWKIESL